MKGGRLLDAQLGPQLLAELAELAAEKAAFELPGDATAQLCVDYLSMGSVPREAFLLLAASAASACGREKDRAGEFLFFVRRSAQGCFRAFEPRTIVNGY